MAPYYFIRAIPAHLQHRFVHPHLETANRHTFCTPELPRAFVIHRDKVKLINDIHAALAHSSGKSHLYLSVQVDAAFANYLFSLFPVEAGVTRKSSVMFQPTRKHVSHGHFLNKDQLKLFGIEIITLAPLSVLQGATSEDVIWVSLNSALFIDCVGIIDCVYNNLLFVLL